MARPRPEKTREPSAPARRQSPLDTGRCRRQSRATFRRPISRHRSRARCFPNRRAAGTRRQTTKEDDAMRRPSAALIALLLLFVAATPVVAAEGQLTWAVHISLAPTWFDPADTPGIVTPVMILYALHEAVAKPMPWKTMPPSLAERGTGAPGGLAHGIDLR